MPQFGPGELRTARVPMTNPTGGAFDYVADLYMGTNLALMAETAFHLESLESKDISLPITMPTVSGTYPVHIGVFSGGVNIGLWRATEDVVIAPEVVYAWMWMSPNRYSNSYPYWSYCERAYDKNLDTAAHNWREGYGRHLELLLASPLPCSKVRINADGIKENPYVDIDLYYENNWHNVFRGTITRRVWVEVSIPAGIKVVSKARIETSSGSLVVRVWEFEFWVEAPV